MPLTLECNVCVGNAFCIEGSDDLLGLRRGHHPVVETLQHLSEDGVSVAQSGEVDFEARPNRTARYVVTARAALERGLEAQMKFYGAEARAGYQEALESDPEFVAAKVMLMMQDRKSVV